MEPTLTVQHTGAFTRVVIAGAPTLGQAMSMVELLALESTAWDPPFVLFDLRGVTTIRNFTEQYSLGQAVARHFQHLKRIASLVPAGRRTGASEKTARQAGANLMVFEDESAAIGWVRGQPL